MNNPVVDSTPIWPFVCVIFIMIVALAWLAWKYWKLTKCCSSQKEEKPTENNAQVKNLRKQLEENEKSFNKLIPIVERYVALRDGMIKIAEKLSSKEKLESLKALLIKAKLWDKTLLDEDGERLIEDIFRVADEFATAESTIKSVQKRIQQFYGLLRTIDLDEASERQIRSDFLELSMLMIDVLESINNPNYNEGTQGVNVKLLKGEISLDDAIAMTSPVTFLDIETSPWAQKLYKSIEKWAVNGQQEMVEPRHYLLNGQRFEFNR